jgi:hypothetical protein
MRWEEARKQAPLSSFEREVLDAKFNQLVEETLLATGAARWETREGKPYLLVLK